MPADPHAFNQFSNKKRLKDSKENKKREFFPQPNNTTNQLSSSMKEAHTHVGLLWYWKTGSNTQTLPQDHKGHQSFSFSWADSQSSGLFWDTLVNLIATTPKNHSAQGGYMACEGYLVNKVGINEDY